MATTTSSNSFYDGAVESATPLLRASSSTENDRPRRSLRRQRLRYAARILRGASSRRMMREPSMLVRETAAEQLEDRQSDWSYSKPVVVVDILWNLAFLVAVIVVMVLSHSESPSRPLRVWIVGYAFQCLIHMLCVCIEFRRRKRIRNAFSLNGGGVRSGDNLSPGSQGSHYVSLMQFEEDNNSTVAKHLESANTMFSFIWWIIGFYWVSGAGQAMAHDSPQLYWLCVIFLAFDVFFVVFCVGLACIIGIAVCCCLPCIIALLYFVADEDGASKEDIERLPKFDFRKSSNAEKQGCEIQVCRGGIMTECATDSPIQRFLSPENAECCICLCAYDDGAEIRELPCDHHFHCACVDKWLRINATCPLCKLNILKTRAEHGEEQV